MWQLLWCVTAACAAGQTESDGISYASEAQCEQAAKRLFVGDRAFCVREDSAGDAHRGRKAVGRHPIAQLPMADRIHTPDASVRV